MQRHGLKFWSRDIFKHAKLLKTSKQTKRKQHGNQITTLQCLHIFFACAVLFSEFLPCLRPAYLLYSRVSKASGATSVVVSVVKIMMFSRDTPAPGKANNVRSFCQPLHSKQTYKRFPKSDPTNNPSLIKFECSPNTSKLQSLWSSLPTSDIQDPWFDQRCITAWPRLWAF